MQLGHFRGFEMVDHHPDAREGIQAFREKRQPRFNQWLEAR